MSIRVVIFNHLKRPFSAPIAKVFENNKKTQNKRPFTWQFSPSHTRVNFNPFLLYMSHKFSLYIVLFSIAHYIATVLDCLQWTKLF